MRDLALQEMSDKHIARMFRFYRYLKSKEEINSFMNIDVEDDYFCIEWELAEEHSIVLVRIADVNECVDHHGEPYIELDCIVDEYDYDWKTIQTTGAINIELENYEQLYKELLNKLNELLDFK